MKFLRGKMGPKGKEKKAGGDEKSAKKAEVAVSAGDDGGKAAVTVMDIKRLEQEVRSTSIRGCISRSMTSL